MLSKLLGDSTCLFSVYIDCESKLLEHAVDLRISILKIGNYRKMHIHQFLNFEKDAHACSNVQKCSMVWELATVISARQSDLQSIALALI